MSWDLPFSLPADLEIQRILGAVVGLILVIAGRRLYWLALGAVGFAAGLWIFGQVQSGFDHDFRWILATLLGLVGAFGAIYLQKLAVSVLGFFAGLMAVFWLSQPWRVDLGANIWWIALVGAALGTFFSSGLFEAGLIAATSILGATLLCEASGWQHPEGSILFLGLVVVGCLAQPERGRKKRRRAKNRDDGDND